MSECLRCGQLGDNGLFCNQCHSLLNYRFQETRHQGAYLDLTHLKLTTAVHNAAMPQSVKRSPFSFTLRRFIIALTVMIVIVFMIDTVLATLVVSKHQFLSTYLGSLPIAAFTPSPHIKDALLPGQSYDDAKSDNSESSPTTLSVLAVSPDNLAFSALQGQPDPPEEAVAIANMGAGELSWHVQSNSSGAAWLTMNVTAGSLNSGQVIQIALHVSCTGLLAGTYQAHVLISALDSSGALSAGSPHTFKVDLDILPVYNVDQHK